MYEEILSLGAVLICTLRGAGSVLNIMISVDQYFPDNDERMDDILMLVFKSCDTEELIRFR